MLIIALVLAVIGLAALVFAVVTSNELVAWVCIAASVLGVVLLIIDALQERRRREAGTPADKPAAAESTQQEVNSAGESGADENAYADYPEDAADEGEESVPNGVGTSQRPAQSTESRSEDEE